MKLFKSHKRAHLTFQKPIECSLLFQKLREISSIFIPPIGKTAQQTRERIQPIEKRNQSDDALSFFENSNEIQ